MFDQLFTLDLVNIDAEIYMHLPLQTNINIFSVVHTQIYSGIYCNSGMEHLAIFSRMTRF